MLSPQILPAKSRLIMPRELRLLNTYAAFVQPSKGNVECCFNQRRFAGR